MKKQAVIYSRVSSTNDRQNTERQVEDLKSYASKNDFEVVKVFEEKISGAKKMEEKPVLMECLDYCTANKIDCLLVSELSRVGRSTLQVLKSLEILHESKVNVYIQNLNLYTLLDSGEINPMASIIITVMAEMAAIERTNIQYRLNSGRSNYIAKGGKLGRGVGSIKTTEKKKEEYKQVISLLKKGNSIRNTAKIANVGVSTVQRVKKEFGL
ncbi:MAG: recombinase family protein [Prevotellaceae bacterium]|jgi:DNA invertase Pin-like site-specific DNA recombinase|nr:recombinase family protein [Prevotellaceae bacterium]